MPMVDLRPQKKLRCGQDLVTHLETFELELKFSAGVWFFAPGGNRFHERYCDRKALEQVLDEAAQMKQYGLSAIEGHYPNEFNEDNADMLKQWCADTGIRVVSVVPNLFYDAQFEFGSLSNPDASIRRVAIERTKTTLQLNQELGTDFAIVWPGIDGYDNTFGQNHALARQWFAEGLAEAQDAVPGVRICVENKPYEPRPNILYGTTPQALLLCDKVEGMLTADANRQLLADGHCLMGMNPEYGHAAMAFEDWAYALSMMCEYGRLGHTHWNAQPAGNYDQDQNVGVISPEQSEAGLYVLRMHGYSGYFGIDINPERMPVQRALLNNMDALRGMNERVGKLDHARIVECIEKPAENRGVLEALLIRARWGDTGAEMSPAP